MPLNQYSAGDPPERLCMRVAAAGLRVAEVPVGQRRRAGGVSKVSGNWWVAARVAGVFTATFVSLALQLRTAASG
jgi:hypothetical protein